MSLASSRRGRPNNRRNGDSELEPSTIRLVGQFRSQIYAALEPPVVGVFEVAVECMSSSETADFYTLDETLSIPDGETVARGPVPVFRFQLFHNRRDVLAETYLTLDDEDVVLDLNRARVSTEAEIASALEYEPPAPSPKPAPVRTYRRIPRKPNDNASYLGFSVGSGDEKIKLASGHTVCAFHLPSAQIIGRILTSLVFAPHSNAYVELSVFDAAGDRKLYIELTSPTARFDQLRLEPGDHLFVFRCKNRAVEGTGSYHHPNARVIANLPPKPDIDALLWGDQSDMAPGIRCAVPCFEFTSR